ncbi:MAG: SDR family NAD(P)-dependent oxidoreductase [Dehalococcoidia bacterium]
MHLTTETGYDAPQNQLLDRRTQTVGRIDGKVALVTGAASGIGAATAELFAREGARVVVADVQDDLGGQVVDRIRTAGGTAEYVHCDVAVAEDVGGMVRSAVDAFGRLDILFNNAGLARGGTVTELSEDDWDLVIDVDLKSVYLGCKYAIPEMRKTGGGSIVSTASIAGLRGSARLTAYSAAKAAVINLTRSIAAEAGNFGIRVNCICPGIIVTPIWRQIGVSTDEQQQERWQMMGQRVLLKRVGMPEDVAKGALFLASDDAAYVTGHALVIDGGLTAADALRDA